MKLKSMGLLNWANLPTRDYEFSEINMITGESGAGKTTLLDALQTILTGTTAGLFQYNPGQEEAAQQSRTKEVRTLASYILGCDDASYARPHGAHGYLFANWVPERGERSKPFVALIGASAYLDMAGSKRTAKEEELVLAVVRSASLCVNDLLQSADLPSDDGGKDKILPVGMLATHFKLNHPGLQFEIARGKEDYLCMLYGGLRGLNNVSRVEARNAAKALSRFMVYKPLKNLDEFVRSEILDSHDITDAIRQVSGMMRSINGMEREAAGIEKGIDLLDTAEKGMNLFITTAGDEQLARYEHNDRKAGQLQRQFEAARQKRSRLIETTRILEREKNTLVREEKQTAEQLSLLEAQRLGVPVLKLKDDLERELLRLDDEMNTRSESLIRLNQIRKSNRDLSVKLGQLLTRAQASASAELPVDFLESLQAVMDTDNLDQLAIGKLLSEQRFQELSEMSTHVGSIDQAHQDLVDRFEACAEPVSRKHFQCQDRVERLGERIKRLKEQIARLENANQVTYPQAVQRALALIADQHPQAAPCVLCDHVELADPAWQIAVEGLLGSNRFLILVDPAHEEQVIDLMVRQGLPKTAILQGRKAMADAAKLTLPETSMVHLLRFTHHQAESYFKARYGNVRLLTETDNPAMTARGLKQNGMACLNYRIFMSSVSEAELVFGTEARGRALKAQQSQLEEMEQQFAKERAELQLYRAFYDASRRIAPVDLAHGIAEVLETASARKEIHERLGALDLTECDALDSKIREVKAAVEDLSARKDRITLDIGSNTKEIETVIQEIKAFDDNLQEKQRHLSAGRSILERYAAQWPDFQLQERIDRIEANRSAPRALLTLEGDNFGARMNDGAMDAELALETYNRTGLRGTSLNYTHFKELNLVRNANTENLVTCFSLACDLVRQIDGSLNFLRNDILAKHKEKLTEMTGRFNSTFVAHICHTLHNAVRQGKSRLDSFNRKLRDHFFGEEYYQFEYKWIPEFHEYYRFFEEAARLNPEAEHSLFGNADLSEESQKIFTEICTKLLDDDIERSVRDLRRISDYRNYRTYDIKKCLPDRAISLKTYGAGSGGQMETPSYVIRSAGLASALRFGEGYSHLRTVIIDESFSKMDETRCKAVLDYLSGTLGLQIIFAVPTKSAGALHDHVDQVLQVTKFSQDLPRGELNTGVMVIPTILKKNPVAELWQRQRVAIENQAHQMTFLELLKK
jgi:energy-coupling factor transporter ATP-binding protein EcfA2